MAKFKKNKKLEQQENKNELEALNIRRQWVKDHFILVPNTTTPKDLNNYQKLIVLRRPQGEQRVIVDFSLTQSEVSRLHNESLVSDIIDINNNQDILRIIPTNVNTKEKYVNNDFTDEEIKEIFEALNDGLSDVAISDTSEFFDVNNSIFKLEDESIKIVDLNFNENNLKKFDLDVDDIDNVKFVTDDIKRIRSSWNKIDDFLVETTDLENRKNPIEFDYLDSKQYVPKPQLLFRNFYNFYSNKNDKYDQIENKSIFYSINDEKYKKENFINQQSQNDEFKNEDLTNNLENNTINNFVKFESEDPSIIANNDRQLDINATSDTNYLHELEQPKTLSFFKNNVNDLNKNLFSGKRLEKHIKFYNKNLSDDYDRHNRILLNSKKNVSYKYKKVIVNKKKKMYFLRKTPIFLK